MIDKKCPVCNEGWGVSLVGMSEQLADLQKQLELKNKQIEGLLKAVEFYQNEDDWQFYCGCCADGSTILEKDHGKFARQALEQFNKMGEK